MPMTTNSHIPEVYRAERAQTQIDTIANNHYERMLELSPETATIAGRKGRETEYDDYSPRVSLSLFRLLKTPWML